MKEQDQKMMESVEACNRFENFLLNALSKARSKTRNDEGVGDAPIKAVVNKGIEWIRKHPREEVEVILRKHKKYELRVEKIMDEQFPDEEEEEDYDDEEGL
jgi:hypothetical protein